MGPDSRVLVRKSRKQAEQYYKLYKERIPVTQLVRETAVVMQEFTQSGFEREDAAYQVYEDQSVSEALSVLSEKRVVVVAVVHRNNRELVGSVRYTDISLLLDNDNRIKSAANWMSCKQWDCHLFVID